MSEHEYEVEEFVNSDMEDRSLEAKPKKDTNKGLNISDRNIALNNRQSSGRFKEQTSQASEGKESQQSAQIRSRSQNPTTNTKLADVDDFQRAPNMSKRPLLGERVVNAGREGAGSYNNIGTNQKKNKKDAWEENVRLKKELAALAQMVDTALNKERNQRMFPNRVATNQDEEVKEKMQQLKDQFVTIENNRRQIYMMKRNLESVQTMPRVKEKEDELKAAQKELNELMREIETLSNVRVKSNPKEEELEQKREMIKQTMNDMREFKESNRKNHEKWLMNDKIMKKNHEKIIIMEERCRILKQKIRDKLADKNNNSNATEADNESLEELERKVEDYTKKKVTLEQKLAEDVKKYEKEKKNLKISNANIEKYIKETEKQIRLDQIRLKEIKKLCAPQGTKNGAGENEGSKLNKEASRISDIGGALRNSAENQDV